MSSTGPDAGRGAARRSFGPVESRTSSPSSAPRAATRSRWCHRAGTRGWSVGPCPRPERSSSTCGVSTPIGAVDTTAAQVTVGAGATLAALQAHVRSDGLSFGVDLSARDTATIGGMVATNAGGLHVVKHGSMRAQVLGVQAVLGTGELVEANLAGLLKDNTGYDLPGLLCGSEGTLGIVTAARAAPGPDAGRAPGGPARHGLRRGCGGGVAGPAGAALPPGGRAAPRVGARGRRGSPGRALARRRSGAPCWLRWRGSRAGLADELGAATRPARGWGAVERGGGRPDGNRPVVALARGALRGGGVPRTRAQGGRHAPRHGGWPRSWLGSRMLSPAWPPARRCSSSAISPTGTSTSTSSGRRPMTTGPSTRSSTSSSSSGAA